MKTKLAMLAIGAAIVSAAFTGQANAQYRVWRDELRLAGDNYRIYRDHRDIAHDH